MTRRGFALKCLYVILPAMLLTQAVLADFNLSWHSVDGGGGSSAGGTYQLTGVIGQHDVGQVAAGGSYQLTGGFLSGAIIGPACACPADVSADGLLNGRDVKSFVNCMLGTAPNCACAELDGANGLSSGDVVVFINSLMTGSNCQ